MRGVIGRRSTRRTKEYGAGRVGGERLLQRDVLREVMLSAAECDTWLTLEELTRITRYPAASISAQLRHLRKPRHGGFRLEKRCRKVVRTRWAGVALAFTPGPVWEYRLSRNARLAISQRAGRRSERRAQLAQVGGARWA